MTPLQKKALELVYVRTRKSMGGQTVGLIDTSVTLVLDEFDIEIKVGNERSQLKNRELAQLLMELAITEIIKE